MVRVTLITLETADMRFSYKGESPCGDEDDYLLTLGQVYYRQGAPATHFGNIYCGGSGFIFNGMDRGTYLGSGTPICSGFG